MDKVAREIHYLTQRMDADLFMILLVLVAILVATVLKKS